MRRRLPRCPSLILRAPLAGAVAERALRRPPGALCDQHRRLASSLHARPLKTSFVVNKRRGHRQQGAPPVSRLAQEPRPGARILGRHWSPPRRPLNLKQSRGARLYQRSWGACPTKARGGGDSHTCPGPCPSSGKGERSGALYSTAGSITCTNQNSYPSTFDKT